MIVCRVDDKYVFYFNNLLKTSRPGKHLEPLIVKQYDPDAELCPFKLLTEYIRRTWPIRGNAKQLLISFQKPFNVVSTDTISRWLKTEKRNFLVTAQGLHPRQLRVKHLFQLMQYWKPLGGQTLKRFKNILISHYSRKPTSAIYYYRFPQVNYALLF